jgi:putative Holliday junction resolvase
LNVLERGAVLAFDFGVQRLGVAVGDWENRMAHPLEAIVGDSKDRRFGRIGELVLEWRPRQMVVGLPLTLAGAEQDNSQRARRFANQLHGRHGLPVLLVDERLTTCDANRLLREAGVKGNARRALDDAVAAQQILQDYFDYAHALISAPAQP